MPVRVFKSFKDITDSLRITKPLNDIKEALGYLQPSSIQSWGRTPTMPVFGSIDAMLRFFPLVQSRPRTTLTANAQLNNILAGSHDSNAIPPTGTILSTDGMAAGLYDFRYFIPDDLTSNEIQLQIRDSFDNIKLFAQVKGSGSLVNQNWQSLIIPLATGFKVNLELTATGAALGISRGIFSWRFLNPYDSNQALSVAANRVQFTEVSVVTPSAIEQPFAPGGSQVSVPIEGGGDGGEGGGAP